MTVCRRFCGSLSYETVQRDEMTPEVCHPFKIRVVSLLEFCLLGYNAMQSVERQPTLRRNISPPSSGPT